MSKNKIFFIIALVVSIVWSREVEISELDESCQKNDFETCTFLGLLYENGIDVDKDLQKAAKYYEKACKGKESLGCFYLGTLYFSGDGVSKDYQKAKNIFEKACRNSYAPACYNVGVMYTQGYGVAVDYDKAYKYYIKACSDNFALACVNLGLMYYKGLGLPKNAEKAVELYAKACLDGEANGCYYLGLMNLLGEGIEQDINSAIDLLKIACDGNVSDSCYALGSFYHTGEYGIEKNDTKALKYLDKACDGNISEACYMAGTLAPTIISSFVIGGHANIVIGKKFKISKTYYEKACELGLQAGCESLKRLEKEAVELLPYSRYQEIEKSVHIIASIIALFTIILMNKKFFKNKEVDTNTDLKNYAWELYDEPIELDVENYLEKPFITLSGVGYLNPMGPTLTLVGLSGDLDDGGWGEILVVNIHPLSGYVRQIGRLQVGAYKLDEEALLELLKRTGIVSAPSFFIPVKIFDEETQVYAYAKFVMGLSGIREHYRNVMTHAGNPRERLEDEIKQANAMAKEYLLENREPKGYKNEKPLSFEEATKMVEMQISPENFKNEFELFMELVEEVDNFYASIQIHDHLSSVELTALIQHAMVWWRFPESPYTSDEEGGDVVILNRFHLPYKIASLIRGEVMDDLKVIVLVPYIDGDIYALLTITDTSEMSEPISSFRSKAFKEEFERLRHETLQEHANATIGIQEDEIDYGNVSWKLFSLREIDENESKESVIYGYLGLTEHFLIHVEFTYPADEHTMNKKREMEAFMRELSEIIKSSQKTQERGQS